MPLLRSIGLLRSRPGVPGPASAAASALAGRGLRRLPTTTGSVLRSGTVFYQSSHYGSFCTQRQLHTLSGRLSSTAGRPVIGRRGFSGGPRRLCPPPPPPPPESDLPRIFEPRVLFIQAVVIVVVAGIGVYVCLRHREYMLWQSNATDMQTIGTPDIGGPFTMVDMSGRPVTQASYFGKWTMIYFGFCNCPEICPEQMEKLGKFAAAARKRFPDDVLVPIYISIDPERDHLIAIRKYVAEFSPDIVGLTGTPAQIDRVARTWRVYYNVPDEYDSKTDYLIDHSIVTYLMSPRGEFVGYYTKDHGPEDVIQDGLAAMEKWKKTESPF